MGWRKEEHRSTPQRGKLCVMLAAPGKNKKQKRRKQMSSRSHGNKYSKEIICEGVGKGCRMRKKYWLSEKSYLH